MDENEESVGENMEAIWLKNLLGQFRASEVGHILSQLRWTDVGKAWLEVIESLEEEGAPEPVKLVACILAERETSACVAYT